MKKVWNGKIKNYATDRICWQNSVILIFPSIFPFCLLFTPFVELILIGTRVVATFTKLFSFLKDAKIYSKKYNVIAIFTKTVDLLLIAFFQVRDRNIKEALNLLYSLLIHHSLYYLYPWTDNKKNNRKYRKDVFST